MIRKREKPDTLPLVRCAIYTRKSTEEGLEQEFNSLDAQRESAEAFIASQKHEGWSCLPDRYDDGGFSGGNADRPGLRRLLEDIGEGRIDCVVVYKVDRLSRSLLDFAGMMQTFQKHNVSFVSVTQQFNTSTSMGRLILNVLLSFAQFEREIISERTRDKIAATRRKGKWSGGHPPLGFDVDPKLRKLVVNETEAAQVQAIFDLYLEHQSLLPVVRELEERNWTNKRWINRGGQQSGGGAFTRTNVHRILTNVLYVGKIRYRDEIHEGEHPAIVDLAVFERTQAILQHNGQTGGAGVRNQFGALLKGLLRCTPCGCTMTPSHTTKKKSRRYRYYVCTNAQKRGWDHCPSKSIPAEQIEQIVVDQIRCVGRDPALLERVISQAREQNEARLKELETERSGLNQELVHWHGESQKLSKQLSPEDTSSSVIQRLADLQEQIAKVEQRAAKVRSQVRHLRQQQLDEEEVSLALSSFDPVWETLTPVEQARVIRLLVEQVDYDGSLGKVSITFHPSGIRALAEELSELQQEQTA